MTDKKPVIIAIEFDAEVRQIKTMVDHSVNVTINIPEPYLEQAKLLMDKLQDMVRVVIV
jgi:hypothetical protein